MVKIFKIDFLIENDRLQLKLTEYEIWVKYRAYLLRYRLPIRKENRTIEQFDALNDVIINQMTLK